MAALVGRPDVSTGQQPEPPAQGEPDRWLAALDWLDVKAEMRRVQRGRRWAAALYIGTAIMLMVVLVIGFQVVSGLPDDQSGLAGLSWLALGVAGMTLLLLASTTLWQLVVPDPFPPERFSLAIIEAELHAGAQQAQAHLATIAADVAAIHQLLAERAGPPPPPPES